MLLAVLILAQSLSYPSKSVAVPATCAPTEHVRGDGTCEAPAAGGSLPSGIVVAILTGSCPVGWTEQTALAGYFMLATTTLAGDAGTVGGSDAITPTGTVSQPTFTGSVLAAHDHGAGTYDAAAGSAGTPAGTNSAPAFTGAAWAAPALSWPAGVPTHSGTAATFTGTPFTSIINHTHVVTINAGTTDGTWASFDSSTTAGTGHNYTSANPVGGVASITPAGSVSITNQGTVAWPVGVPTIGAYTPTGTVAAPAFTGAALGDHDHALSGSSASVTGGTPSGTVSQPTFTGAQFDNRPAWVKLIWCKKD